MKMQKLVCTAVLGSVVVALGAPVVTNAAELSRTLKGESTVKFKEDTGGEGLVDPEDPDKEVDIDITEGDNNKDKEGLLRLDFVSHLKFGEQKVTTSKGEYYAAPTTIKEGGVERKVGNYVQVTDKRGNDNPQGWKLEAQVTKPFTNTSNKVLKGAKIYYTLPFVNAKAATPATSYPTANTITLDTTDSAGLPASQEFAKAEIGQGWGKYTIEYGRPDLGAATPATMDKAVKLEVPANTQLSTASEYKAEITWTISEL